MSKRSKRFKRRYEKKMLRTAEEVYQDAVRDGLTSPQWIGDRVRVANGAMHTLRTYRTNGSYRCPNQKVKVEMDTLIREIKSAG